jgi:hypothetical protein
MEGLLINFEIAINWNANINKVKFRKITFTLKENAGWAGNRI